MKPRRALFHRIIPPPPAPARPVSFRRWLGPRPPAVTRRVECLERRVLPCCVREKILYNLEPDLATVAWLCRPKGKERFPAVLCCHGTGPGKDPLVGLWNGRECLEYHKRCALRLAERGYVTLAPDRRGFGECAERPYNQKFEQYLRELDEFYLRTRGVSRTALDTWDMVCALDVLAKRPEVDAARIACVGVYDGATVAAGAAALDSRIRAVSLVCFNGQPPVCGQIAPRPVQLQIARAGSPALPVWQGAHVERHEFDGVVELDFPALVEWLARHL